MEIAAYPKLDIVDDCCSAVAIWISQSRFGKHDFLRLQSIADRFLTLGCYTPLLADLYADLPLTPPALSEIEDGFGFHPNEEQSQIILFEALAKWADPIDGLKRIFDFSVAQDVDNTVAPFRNLFIAYCDLEEPPGIKVPFAMRDQFARAAWEQWLNDFRAEREAIPRVKAPPLA